MRYLIFLLLLTVRAGFCQTQDTKPLVVGARLHYGFIIPHSKDLKPVSQTNPWGISIEASRLFLDERTWGNCNCFSKLGLAFNYHNFANPDVLGNAYSLMIFAEPFLGFRRRLKPAIRAGMGPAYMDTVHDPVTNPTNTFYSARFNALLMVNLGLHYSINSNSVVDLVFNYNHISNGGARHPNKGINFPTFSLGYSYQSADIPFPEYGRSPGLLERKWIKYARIFWSLRSIDESGQGPDDKKLMIGLEAGVMRAVTNVNAIILGFEANRDGSHKVKAELRGEDYDHHAFMPVIGHALIFGNFGFSQAFGYYLYHPYPRDQEFFQRYIVFYQFGKYLNLGMSLKAHAQVAEHGDIRIGIMF